MAAKPLRRDVLGARAEEEITLASDAAPARPQAQVEHVLITQIRTNGGTQIRPRLNQERVESYAEKMTNGTAFPAIDLYYDGAEYWIGDGFHRLAAHQRAFPLVSHPTIGAIVHAGTRRDAVLHAAGANDEHGEPRDKDYGTRAAEILLRDEEWARWSNREIARRCKIHHSTVADIRKRLEASGAIRQIEERTVERGGTVYTQQPKAKPKARPETVATALHAYFAERQMVLYNAEQWVEWLTNVLDHELAKSLLPTHEVDSETFSTARWIVCEELITRCLPDPARNAGWSAYWDFHNKGWRAKGNNTTYPIVYGRFVNFVGTLGAAPATTRPTAYPTTQPASIADIGRALLAWLPTIFEDEADWPGVLADIREHGLTAFASLGKALPPCSLNVLRLAADEVAERLRVEEAKVGQQATAELYRRTAERQAEASRVVIEEKAGFVPAIMERVVEDEPVIIECPKCGAEQEDHDGFGVIHCDACDYCAHPSSTDGVCDICGQPDEPTLPATDSRLGRIAAIQDVFGECMIMLVEYSELTGDFSSPLAPRQGIQVMMRKLNELSGILGG